MLKSFRSLLMLIGKNWCCQTGLNCRPLHYQWSALPLSYGSMPGIQGIGPKGPYRRPVLATRTPLAQARGGAGKGPKWAKIGMVAGLIASNRANSGRSVPFPSPAASDAGADESLRSVGEAIARWPGEFQYDRGKEAPRRRRQQAQDAGRSGQTRGNGQAGCERFATAALEAGAARKSQAAEVAGARAQR